MQRDRLVRQALATPRAVHAATLLCQGLIVLRYRGIRAAVRSVQDWRRAVRRNREESRSPTNEIRPVAIDLAAAPAAGGRPLVSVVVRTRNRPAELAVALDSLARQTFRSFEVVVVNDGGDDIGDVLERYEGGLELRYVRNSSAHGRSQAVNDGVHAAVGEYVTFLDDDDVVYPLHLATLVEAVEQREVRPPFVYSHYRYALVSGRGATARIVRYQYLPSWSFDRMELLAANRPPIHTWLLPRAVFEEHGGFDSTFEVLHDWDFLLRVTERMQMGGLPRETCEYRIYLDLDNSVTRGRQHILDDARLIHERHPADSALVSLARKLQLARFEFQVEYANALNSKVEAGVVTQEAAALQFIHAVFGLT